MIPADSLQQNKKQRPGQYKYANQISILLDLLTLSRYHDTIGDSGLSLKIPFFSFQH